MSDYFIIGIILLVGIIILIALFYFAFNHSRSRSNKNLQSEVLLLKIPKYIKVVLKRRGNFLVSGQIFFL